MKRKELGPVIGIVFFLFPFVCAQAQEPISIGQTSSSARSLANGSTEMTFEADISLNVIPIAFNFHWERSDGAKTAVKVVSVRSASEQSYKLVEKWVVRQGVQIDRLWEKVYVNSGNTHLASDPITPGSVAESPAPVGAHPAYLRALSDMRLARGLLMGWTNPLIAIPVQSAIAEIEGAVNEITRAAISDGKDIDDHPPIDTSLANRNRLVRSLELLNKAYADIDQKETNPSDLALRSRALGHISKARQDLTEARRIASWL